MKKTVYILILLTLLVTTPTVVHAESLLAPSYVTAFVYSSGNIRISWDNEVDGATRFTIQRQTDSGSFVTLVNLPANVSSYNDTSISNGHTYVYRVFATSGSVLGPSEESYPVEYIYPSSLAAKGISDSVIELEWSYPSSNKIPDTNFQTVIERRGDGSSTWQTVSTVPGTETTYSDTNLSEGSRYHYRIRALTATSALYLYYPNNSSGQYANTLLKAPAKVTAKIISKEAVEITWEDMSDKETSYLVERKLGNGNFARLKTLNANVTSFVDKSAINGQQYTYRVTAQGTSFRGNPSAEVVVPFLFPTSFDIEATYSTQMTLSWGYPGSGYITPDNSRVLIERREAGKLKWEQVHVTYPGDTEYTDNDLKPGTRYYYRIRSRYNNDFITDYFPSNSGISDITKLSFETHFSGYALSTREVLLEWDEAAAGNHTIFVEKLDSTGVYKPVTTLKNAGAYIDVVEPGSVNSYRLKIRSQQAESDYTPAIDITAEQLPAVEKPTIKAVIPQRVFLTWEYDKSLESGFEIWRMAESEGVWKHIDTVERGHLMYSDEHILNGEIYTYRIRAVKSYTIFSPFAQTRPVPVAFAESNWELAMSQSDGMIYLGWEDISDMEQYYAVEYKTNINDAWHILDKLPKNVSLYRFIPAQGVDYTLRVRAVSENPLYESISTEKFYSTKTPATPSLISPTIKGSKRVVLTWVDLSDNEDTFVIYRKNNDEHTFQAVGTTDANMTVFADEAVFPGQRYTYMIRSKNAAGESFDSNEIIVETPINIYFTDLGTHPWARESIEALAEMGIVNGVGEGNYNPSGNITRAEFIKLLVATFSFPESPIGSFGDVTPGDWYHRWVMTAYRQGIIEPDGYGMFHPNARITRQDIVYFSAQAIKAAGLNLEQPPLYILYKYSDYDEVSGYAQSAFATMNYAGIINGIGNDKLGPLNPATRAEAATIIYRMIQVLEKDSVGAY